MQTEKGYVYDYIVLKECYVVGKSVRESGYSPEKVAKRFL